MRRARTRIRTIVPVASAEGRTIPQRDEATGTDAGDAPYARMRLPHERDEDVASQQGDRQPVIRQAERDLAEGRMDTDRYGEARLNFRRRYTRRRR